MPLFISSPSSKYAVPELERISMQPNRYDNYYRDAVSKRLHPIHDTDRYVSLYI